MTSNGPRGFTHALHTFYEAAERVPAYKQFLQEHGIIARDIKTYEDYQKVPLVTKKNYLTKYPFHELLWDGETHVARTISMSSGSSGQPFFWPRGTESVSDSIDILDRTFAENFSTDTKSTLCIIAFAMGTWIAGTYMFSAMWGLADRGHKISTITPGIKKEEVIRIIKLMHGNFDQILLMGYPPFIKDVIDHGCEEGVDFPSLEIKFIFAGENFSETWRDYVLGKVGQEGNIHIAHNMYGTADAGIMGIESPLSIAVRRLCAENAHIFKRVFPKAPHLPTLVQYEPELRFAEEVDGTIVFTINSSLPLIRYSILDHGRVMTLHQMVQEVEEAGGTVPHGLTEGEERGFIALYGRPDVVATFYALNIYPENIKYGIEHKKFETYLTGKFTIDIRYSETQEQSLHINLELCPKQEENPDLSEEVAEAIVQSLQKNNSEYAKLHLDMGDSVLPHIHYLPNGDSEFTIGTKHKWIHKG